MMGKDTDQPLDSAERHDGIADEQTGNLLSMPSRRDLLRQAAVAGALAFAGPLRALAQQDTAGRGALKGTALPGVVRHRAMFWRPTSERRIRCLLCPRECEVANLERGWCGVRENRDGEYQTLVYGALCAANVDPIEKKPLFHYLPGTRAFSVATAGCNMECKFCQNWRISQYRPEQVESVSVPPARLVGLAKAYKCPTIAYTYTEPIIFYEYMYDSAALARKAGVGGVMISNGFINPKPLRELCKHLTAVKIDLKAFTDQFYRKVCRGMLKPVLRTLEVLKEVGIWFEIVVLIIPTLNDSSEEIRRMSKWICSNLGPDVPVHFSRFHPMYRLTNLPVTPVRTLDRARRIALDAGLHFVYVGNVPFHPGGNTYCPSCGRVLIRRVGYKVLENSIGADGKCPSCGATIAGVWSQKQALSFKPSGA